VLFLIYFKMIDRIITEYFIEDSFAETWLLSTLVTSIFVAVQSSS
jgi:hypothetical protein